MKRIITASISVLMVMLCLLTLYSCSGDFDKDGFETDGSVSITLFKVNSTEATIDQVTGQITLTLPYNSSISTAVPEIEIPEGATINPGIGSTVDFSNPVYFRVVNGNLYKDYVVNVVVLAPIISFKINDVSATINNTSKTITMTLPEGTSLAALQPVIEVSEGVSISPSTGTTLDFTNPVDFTVTSGTSSEIYTASIATPATGVSVAFLGTAATRPAITNLDEKEASDWLYANFSDVTYISFADIDGGIDLSSFDVIWWHYDSATNLPTIALDNDVINALKSYRINGGNLLLTTFASQYVDALEIVPTGKGPNNVFGDFPPAGFVDSSSWGMSFIGHEDHPIFVGLETFEPGKAKLLQGGTFRLNHTAWWFVPEWGGYVNGAGWRSQTGGINLASEDWDNTLDGRVTIAEWSTGTNVDAVVISMGAYDWYNEPDSSGNPSQSNELIGNIELMTKNTINYLAQD